MLTVYDGAHTYGLDLVGSYSSSFSVTSDSGGTLVTPTSNFGDALRLIQAMAGMGAGSGAAMTTGMTETHHFRSGLNLGAGSGGGGGAFGMR